MWSACEPLMERTSPVTLEEEIHLPGSPLTAAASLASVPLLGLKGFSFSVRPQKAASTREASITTMMAASVAATRPSTNRAKVRNEASATTT